MPEVCPSCDFCEVTPDGMLICALHDEQVHGDETCDCWQNEWPIDGDNDYDKLCEVMNWPNG